MAQDLLWEYAKRRREVDAQFSADLRTALRLKGFDGWRAPPEGAAAPTKEECERCSAPQRDHFDARGDWNGCPREPTPSAPPLGGEPPLGKFYRPKDRARVFAESFDRPSTQASQSPGKFKEEKTMKVGGGREP
jgi:hypothetical protein